MTLTLVWQSTQENENSEFKLLCSAWKLILCLNLPETEGLGKYTVGSLTWVGQPVLEKEDSVFKPVVLCLKIDDLP